MSKDVSKSFESYFGDLKDPRVERSKLYPLDFFGSSLAASEMRGESERQPQRTRKYMRIRAPNRRSNLPRQ